MKWIYFFLLCVLSSSGFSQDFQKEINDQVWKSFISSFNNYDANGFLTVHTKDVVRSPLDAKKILTYDEYLQNQLEGNKRGKESGNTRALGLRFTERIANAATAIDIGIFKVTVSRKNGSTQSFYGRFHVVLRKENGVWKILVDMDSSEGRSIDEADYVAARAME
jgi:ketosteroid isomerase-like protein